MSWRDRLVRASFRGVPFEVRSADGGGGRRQPEHVFPNRDRATNDDLGRRRRVFQIDGYLVGDDYDLERERLWLAFEKPGPGRLVHPYYGTMLVYVPRFRFLESLEEGGMARVSFEAREAVGLVQPRRPNPRAQAKTAGDGIEDASASRLESGLQVVRLPEIARSSISDVVRGVGRAIESLDVFRGQIAEVERLEAAVRSTIDEANSLVRSPALLAQTVRAALEGIQDSAQNALGALEAYRTIFGNGSAPRLPGPGHISAATNSNLDLAERLIQAGALAGWAEAATRVTWDTRDQAEAERDALLAAIDQWSEGADDAELAATGPLIRAVVETVPPEGERLPRLDEHRVRQPTNSLVLTWHLYGDLDEEARLIARNLVPNPAVMPGGQQLEVLVRG